MSKDPSMKTIEGTNVEYMDVTLSLESELTDAELKALANEAAAASEEKAALESEKAEFDKSMKKQIDGKDGVITDRLARHRRGKAPKDVSCRHLFDYDEGKVTTIRLDRDETADDYVVKTREMRPDERQSVIPGSETAPSEETLDSLFPDDGDTSEEAVDDDDETGTDLGNDGIGEEEANR